jgi:hypothetical protein
VGVNSKRDGGKEDHEEKFGAHDTCRDDFSEVFEPPYYQKGLHRNGLINQSAC